MLRMDQKPNSIPIAPKIIPKGTTGIINGKTSRAPSKNIFFFDFITLRDLML